ncbi:RNA polymerase II elongation factor ELL2 isoform X2 [Latimeria chalumnae]|uniref:RNA polymerase II elongation factor ELL2 isoform X2 n=1 Tax=Latimeria chalumnae TaxID=7897 RepID=UPI0003C12FA0|nr:PREDICTED: RNA polymerase II elongation factor ELL2 isoform X2 [Latimeria chalumnae]|eukprot:XP_005990050.1 PREDICTED: RNA polymerase II elongation factor ELL2 isoform X2 [Latimeria chalumnae]
MAALSEIERYGLSCGRVSQGNITVLHVKLTETAFRALENYQNAKKSTFSQPTIQFQGLQGCIKIPRTDVPSEVHNFDFYLSNVGKDNPQGSFDCVQQYVSSFGALQLDCMGIVQDKITICATNDSYQMTRKRMTQAEEETRSRSTKVIKPGGPFVGKRVQIRRPPQSVPDAVPERKRSTPINPASTLRKPNAHSSISQRPYRDRVVHLLALKPYKKPELLVRLQKDGVNQKDKNSLGAVLQQVANLNPRDHSYTLKDYVFKELQKDWPGYSEDDRQQLERVLSRRLNQSQNSSSGQSDSQTSSSPKDAASASPPQHLLEGDFIDPLMIKKPRISHLTNRVQPTLNGHLSSGDKSATAAVTPGPPLLPPSTHLPVPNPNHTVNSNSNSPTTPEGRGPQDLPIDSFSQKDSTYIHQQNKYNSRTPEKSPPLPSAQLECSKPLAVECSSSIKKSKKKSKKHKDKERERETKNTMEKNEETEKEHIKEKEKLANEEKNSGSVEKEGVSSACPGSTDPSSTSEMPDYLIKYTAIISYEQRQNYKDDFNAEYEEYRNLHARVESITRRFVKLDAERRLLSPGSKEYQVIHEEVLQEYKKMKQTSPNYHEEKYRCEYLHNKLAHIKRLIAEFDQQQAQS